MTLEVEGSDLSDLHHEAGGHRIQRIPPTERRGRVHTSTVTVAILDPTATRSVYDQRGEADFRVEWFSGSGAGGQHRNKHQNSCRLYHIPSGLCEARQGRKREANMRDAKQALHAALDLAKDARTSAEMSEVRKDQVGSGMRGDKIVTIRFQDDQVTHHGTGKRMTATAYMKGYIDRLWR